MSKSGANGPKSRARARQEREGIKYTAAAAAGADRLAAGLAARSDGALTVDQASRRLRLGGQEYRRFLERGRLGVAEALRAALDVPDLHPSRLAPLREALAALDRHAVGPEAQDVAGLYWTARHSEAVSRIWRTPLNAEETADVQAKTDEILHTTVAVQEYLWPTCHDSEPWHPLPGLPHQNRNGAAEPDYGFGGHEFEYEQVTDLFRCSECRAYEVRVRAEDGAISPCPGLGPVSYGGDTERVYLLLSENPELHSNTGFLATKVRSTGLGRAPRFSWRDKKLLVETAPSVADELIRRIELITSPVAVGGREVPTVSSIARLTAEAGRAILAANYAVYVAEYGEDA